MNRVYSTNLKTVVALSALFAVLIVLPHFLKYYQQDFLIFLTINILVVVSYRLVTLTGEWSLIHAVMMGVGAYTSAILSKNFDISFWITLPLAGLAAGTMAALLSYPLFRMTQFYFLIGSFAAGEAIRLCWIQFIWPFGGSGGISAIPSPELLNIDFLEPIPYFYLVLVIVSVCVFLLYRIEKSRIGLTLHAVHWKGVLAESVGVNTWNYRSLAFITGSLFVGLAGALKVHYIGTVAPKQFDIGFMVFILIWVIVGGYRTIYGGIVGAVVLSILNELFREIAQLRPAIYGATLIIFILYLPGGMESIPQKMRSLLQMRQRKMT